MKSRRILLVVSLVALAHLLVFVLYRYDAWSVPKPRKSEIKVEVGGVERPAADTAQQPKPEPTAPALPRPEVKPQAQQSPKQTTKPRDPEGEIPAVAGSDTQTPVQEPVPTTVSSQNTSSVTAVQVAPASDADYKAAYLNNPKPPYPSVAFKMRIEGTVKLMALVMPDGSCEQVKLLKSSGSDLLDQSALATVARWKFVPATSQGKTVEQWVSIPITFSIKPRKD